MKVVIRPAVVEDAGQLMAHMRALEQETDICVPLSPGEFALSIEEECRAVERFAASDNSLMLVAVSAGALIGILTLQGGRRRALRHAAELGISVDREWRHRGIGRGLLEHALAFARSSGVLKRIELQVYVRNAPAIHLYENFGFVAEGRRRRAILTEGRLEDDLIMALLL